MGNKKRINELLALLGQIPGRRLLVLGDIILDRYIWGAAERISPEAPVPVVDVRRIEDRLGGAANVAANLMQLGAIVALCGFVGDDEEGRTLLKILDNAGIHHEGVLVDRERPTTLKTRVIAAAQQLVRIDREQRSAPSAPLCEALAAVFEAQVVGQRGIIVSDYAKGAISEAVVRTVDRMRSTNRIGYPNCPLLLDPHPEKNPLLVSADIVKLNRGEAELASGVSILNPESAGDAARIILSKWGCRLVIVTIGHDGMILCESGSSGLTHLPAEARQVFDVSGAGDTVAAVVSAGLAAGGSAALSAELANIAAGIVVAEVGTAPISSAKIEKALHAQHSMED